MGGFYPVQLLSSVASPSLREAGKQTVRNEPDVIKSSGASEAFLHADFKIPPCFYVLLLILSGIDSIV